MGTEPLVALARFASPVDAQLAKARLEIAGIHSIVRNEASIGEVELRVASSAVDDAIAVLGGTRAARALRSSRAPEETARCLICRSSFLIPEEGSVLLRVFRTLIRSVLPLPSAWFDRRRLRCGVCGHRWKEERSQPDASHGVFASEQHGDRLRGRRRS